MKTKMLFTIHRFQILTKYVASQGESQVPDSLAFAWQKSVFPLFESGPLVECFDEEFEITKDRMEELYSLLRTGDYSSYELEDRGWDRRDLLRALGYFRLSDALDQSIWEKLLDSHPGEADFLQHDFGPEEVDLFKT